jgi:hypothetical protein
MNGYIRVQKRMFGNAETNSVEISSNFFELETVGEAPTVNFI